MKHKRIWLLAIVSVALIAIGAQAQAAPTFYIETAPIFADPGGANKVTGSFGTISTKASALAPPPIPARWRTSMPPVR